MAREFAKPFYNSREWEQTRAYVLKRDCYLCRRCGRLAEEVHHIRHLTPENIGDVKITLNPENLMSLCKACHFKEHVNDKASGKKDPHGKFTEEYGFYENGFLVRIAPPGKI